MKPNLKHSNYFFIALFLIIALISFFVVKELIFAILYSIVLAYFFYPLYDKINSFIKIRWISATLVIILIVFLLIVPLIFVSNQLIEESLNFYSAVRKFDANLTPFLREGLQNIMLSFNKIASDFLFSLPARLLSIFVSLFLLFYLLIDGKNLLEGFKRIIPLDEHKKELYFNEFKNVSYSVIYGSVLTGIIIGILTGIGFYLFNVSSPILLSFVVMILVILPIVGSALVWLPISVLKLTNGDSADGMGLLIYNIILTIISSILTYKLVSKKSKMHPALTILGVIGGLKFFGFIGVIFGPFVLALFITMLKYLAFEK